MEEETPPRFARKDVVETDSDDVLFDAVAGCRRGEVGRDLASEKISAFSFSFDSFERSLLLAQAFVLLSQCILLSGQLTALTCVYKVASDVVAFQKGG